MKRNIICGAAAFFLASALLPAAAQQERIPEALVTTLPEPTEAALKPAPIHPFAAIAGNWTGGGTIDLTGDIHEKLRCRASYTHGKSNNSLVLAIRCASDNYKFELTSNVVERGGQISGTMERDGLQSLRLDQRTRERQPNHGNGERRQLQRRDHGEHHGQQAVGHHHAAVDLHHQRADRDGPGGARDDSGALGRRQTRGGRDARQSRA